MPPESHPFMPDVLCRLWDSSARLVKSSVSRSTWSLKAERCQVIFSVSLPFGNIISDAVLKALHLTREIIFLHISSSDDTLVS